MMPAFPGSLANLMVFPHDHAFRLSARPHEKLFFDLCFASVAKIFDIFILRDLARNVRKPQVPLTSANIDKTVV